MDRKETVSIQMSEIIPQLIDNIKKEYNLSNDTEVEYTSKTDFLTFLIKRNDDN